MSVTVSQSALTSAMPLTGRTPVGSWHSWSHRTWLATVHLVLDLPVGMAWGTLVVVLVAASIGLLPLALLGTPLLVVTLAGSLLAARFERARARLLLDAAPSTTTRFPRTWTGWVRLPIDGRAWLSCGYALLLMPLGVLNATVAVTGWALVLAGVTSQTWVWLLPNTGITIGSWSVEGEQAVVPMTVAALLLGLAMPHLIRALAAVDGWLVRTLLR
ncbi:MAG: sensor domain-containing protein [Actinomycetes bacterium]